MSAIETTPFASFETEGRLYNPILKGVTKAGRFGFRGNIGIKLAPVVSGEKRPPELAADQVIAASDAGSSTLSFFSCYLMSFAELEPLAELLAPVAAPSGTYVIYANNVDLSDKFKVDMNGIPYYVLPIDEATVYNEVLDLLRLEKNALKKLDTAGKQDAILDAVGNLDPSDFKTVTFAEGVAKMGPVRNKGEFRPV